MQLTSTGIQEEEHLAKHKEKYLVKFPEKKNGALGGGRDGVGTRVRTIPLHTSLQPIEIA